MDKAKKIFFKIRDLYEIAVPTLAFAMLFGMFMWGILCRYVLKRSATYANEIQIMGYLWTVLPAALWARRRNDHVCFSMLYDSLRPRGQRWIRILGNLFMVVTYCFLLSGSIKYIVNLRQRSMSLQIPLKILYFPFPILVAGILVYSLWDFCMDVRDIYLERTGKKEPLSNEKIDKAEEFRKASEEEYERLFANMEKEEAELDAELEQMRQKEEEAKAAAGGEAEQASEQDPEQKK